MSCGCMINDNISGYDYIGEPEKKKKKKKKQPASKMPSTGLSIACGVAGGLVSRGLKWVVNKYAPIESATMKKVVANGISITLGGAITMIVKNPMLGDVGKGLIVDGVIGGGEVVYQMVAHEAETPVKNPYKSDEKESLEGTEDYEDDYPEEYPHIIEGADEYGEYDEPETIYLGSNEEKGKDHF